jgi:hypothetical protein
MAQNMERQTIIQKDKKGSVQSVEFSSEDKSVRNYEGTFRPLYRREFMLSEAKKINEYPHDVLNYP